MKPHKQCICVNFDGYFVNTNLLASKLCEFRERETATAQLNI